MQYIYAIAKNDLSLDDVYVQIAYAIDTHKFNDLVEIVEQFVHLYSNQSSHLYKTIFSHKVRFKLLRIFQVKAKISNYFRTRMNIFQNRFWSKRVRNFAITQKIANLDLDLVLKIYIQVVLSWLKT
jgi:hypothetical protein